MSPGPPSTASQLVTSFQTWAQRGRASVEPDVVETLLDFKGSYLGDPQPRRWRTGDLSELLLEVIPRKVTADEQWIDAVVPTVTAFLDFMEQTPGWHPASASVDELRAELSLIAPQFSPAMHDVSRFGMAKSLFSNAASQGFDLSNPAALQRWQDEFNALPFEQRKAITDPSVPTTAPTTAESEAPAAMPAVVLPGTAVLAGAARGVPLARQAVRLAEWVGGGKPVTATGVLKLAAARAAAEQLGLAPAASAHLGLDAADRLAEARSARDLRELHLVWTLAVESGLLRVAKTKVDRGAGWYAWSTDRDQDVLDTWALMADFVFAAGIGGANEPRYWFVEHDAVEHEVMATLPDLYCGNASGTSLEQLTDDAAVLAAHVRDAAGASSALAGDTGYLVREYIGRLVDVGMLAVDADGTVTMSDLGRYAMNRGLVSEGVVAPMLVGPAEVDATTLLGYAGLLAPATFDGAVEAWLGAREPAEAARQLVDAARAGGSSRTTAFMVLESLPEAVAAVLEPLADDPDVGRHSRLWLHAHGIPAEPLSAADEQWLAIDHMATLLALIGQLGASAPPDGLWAAVDERLDLPTAWQADHPQLLEVLEMIARHHPQGRVRKAAKKSLFKARQRLSALG